MSNPIREAELKQKKRESRRAVISSYLGSTVEYYDFLLYGSAASLVFPALFFSDLDQVWESFCRFLP
ncbi:hypothetical protein P4S64_13860 [Vibrio sp. M60_M31a]